MKDLKQTSRIKTEQSKVLLGAGKLLLQERKHLNHVIRDKPKNSIGQLKGNILKSMTPEKFHLVDKIYQYLHKKPFGLTKKEIFRNLMN